MAKIAFSAHEEHFIRKQVEAGNYNDEGEVISAGLQILEELEDAREKWLAQEIPGRFEDLKSDEASGQSLDKAFTDLEKKHRARLADEK